MIHAKNRNSKSRDQQPTKSKQLKKTTAILFFLVSLVVIYVSDEYVSPASDEQSVPGPRTS